MGKQDRYNFDGADDSFDTDTSASAADTRPDDSEPDTESDTDIPSDPATTETQHEPERPATIPHRVRYDSPKDGRKAKTFYLDTDEDLLRLRELQSLAETEFEETVHRLDVYLAAFRSDLSDDGFLQEMQRIGYGYFD